MSPETGISQEAPFVTEKKWPNGFTLLLHHMPHARSVSGRLCVKAGPRYEKPHRVGAHHRIEHLLPDGTPKHKDFLSIYRYLTYAGMDYSFETAFNQSVYPVKATAEHALEIVPYHFDLIQKPRFYRKDRRRETKIINQEILEYVDDPDEHVQTLFEREAWKHFPIGDGGILGTKESLNSFRKKEIEEEFKEFYRPDNMFLVIAGNFPEDEIIKQIDNTFGKLVNPGPSTLDKYPVPFYKPNGKHVVIENRDLEQVQIMLGFPIEKELVQKYFYELDLMGSMIGKSISFKLIHKLGKGYHANTMSWLYSDFGALTFDISVEKRSVPFVVDTMVREINTQKYDQEETALMKQYQITQYTLDLEDTRDVAEHIAESYIDTGKVPSLEQITAKVKDIDEKNLELLHTKIPKTENAILAMLGRMSKKDIPKYEQKLQFGR